MEHGDLGRRRPLGGARLPAAAAQEDETRSPGTALTSPTRSPTPLVITVLCSLSTLAVLIWWPGSNGAWLIVTLLVVTEVGHVDTLKHTAARVSGTAIGRSAARSQGLRFHDRHLSAGDPLRDARDPHEATTQNRVAGPHTWFLTSRHDSRGTRQLRYLGPSPEGPPRLADLRAASNSGCQPQFAEPAPAGRPRRPGTVPPPIASCSGSDSADATGRWSHRRCSRRGSSRAPA